MAKVVEVELTKLKTSFYVRKKLSDDHVLQLALLIESGVNLPPLTISYDNEIIDGRHRKAALEMLGRKTAECSIHGQRSPGEQVILALSANVGGSLPPSSDDITHSMVLLLNQGWTQRRILENMPFPREVSKKYLKTAWGVVLSAKLSAAMKAIAEEGLTVKVAAEKFGVPLEKLQEHMNPNRKKAKQQSAAWRKTHISRAYQGFHRKIAHEIQKVVEGFEDRKISEQEVFDTFDDIFDLINKGTKRVEEHRNRFLSLAKTTSELSKIEIGKKAIAEID